MLGVFLFYITGLYAKGCELVNFENGKNGLLEFKCDEDVSLKNNKLVFYFTGSRVKVDSIKVAGGKTDYDIDKISRKLRRVELNVVTETIFKDLDYTAHEGEIVKLEITPKRKSNLNYKVLWGGVVKNSYKNRKNKNNNLQFYRNKTGDFFAYEDGLECAIKHDCDDKIELSKQCDSERCHKLNQKLSIYSDFGMAHQRIV
ncbi:hypothetical protein LO80_07815 [Candidatus Francisella endociliophora]|uniref:Uncharacterized protein n=1 Tax=Candidatus Francisella endociliophora TaxID=653937 RepID=A0A097ERX8_9GAMM|nr:hypothetical protein LO80_07815 [Francisella sp. FSC1006]